jgi:hypothetical protein
MNVPGKFYVNEHLQKLMFEELEQYVSHGEVGGFLPAVKQLANVAALPGALSGVVVFLKHEEDPRDLIIPRFGYPQVSLGAQLGCLTSTPATDLPSGTSPPLT